MAAGQTPCVISKVYKPVLGFVSLGQQPCRRRPVSGKVFQSAPYYVFMASFFTADIT